MSYFTWNEEPCPPAGRGTRWTSQVPNYSKTIAFLADESPGGEVVDVCPPARPGGGARPPPEGFGTSGEDAQRSASCHSRSVKSLAGQFGGSSADRGRFSPSLAASGTARCALGMPGVGAARRGGGGGEGGGEEERKVAPRCDKCSLTLVALKKQALSLVVHQHFSSKDLAAVSTFLHNNLRVHSSRSTTDPRERDRDQGLCISCGVHLNQLKQEAVQLALSRENSRWPDHASPEHSSGSPPTANPGNYGNQGSPTITGTGSPRRQETGQYGHESSRDTVQPVESEVAGVPQQYSFTQGYMSPQTLQRNQQHNQDRPQDQTQDRMPQWNPEQTQDLPQERPHDCPQDWTTQRTLDPPQSRTPQRNQERNLVCPQVCPQDRTLDLPQDQTPQRTLDHPQAHPHNHHQDQTLDHPESRTPQRNLEWTLDHPQDHPQNQTQHTRHILDPHDHHQDQTPQWTLDRSQNRTTQRNPERTLDHTKDHLQSQTPQRNPERILDHPKKQTRDCPQNQTPQKPLERVLCHPQDQTLDRPQNRTPQRTLERTLDHPQDHPQNRTPQRTLERILDHPQDRTLDLPQNQTPQRTLERTLDHPEDHPQNRTPQRTLERILDHPQDRTLDRSRNRTPQRTLERTLDHPQDHRQNRTPQRTMERILDHPQDRTLDLPQNQTPQRTLKRTLDHPEDHPQNRTPQRTLERIQDHPQDRTLDRSQNRTPQRTLERTLDHPQDHRQNRTPQRTMERILDHPQDRTLDHPQNRTSQRTLERTLDHPQDHPQNRTPQRTMERILDHPQDRTLDRPQNRTSQRTLERTLDHPQDHPQNRTPQRTMERILDHPQDRTLDRPQNRTRHRSLERILDHPQDHLHDRHQDHTPQWNPERNLDRTHDQTQSRTPHWNSEQTLTRTTPQRTLDRPQNRTPQRTLDRTAQWKSEQILNRSQDRTPQHTPERTPQTLRRRAPKASNPDMNRWVAEQQQLYKAGGGVPGGTLQRSPKMAHIARVATIANSAAMAFLARAAQKLNLRRKGPSGGPGGTGPSAHRSTCFRGLIEKNPPPVPPCLLQNSSRTREPQNAGQVKVILRVCPPPPLSSDGPLRAPLLRMDPSRKRVTVVEPTWNSLPRAKLTQRRQEKALFKTYTFDAVYPQEAGQVEVCTGVLTDVIRSVVGGADGCILGLGCLDPGSWSAMVGSDEGHQKLGVMPCSIPWLYGAVERWKERTWTDLSVSVSAVELRWAGRGGPGEGDQGVEESLRDLLAEVAPAPTSGAPGRRAAHLTLHEDPLLGVQVRGGRGWRRVEEGGGVEVMECPTAERAASLLDAAIASRLHGNQANVTSSPACHNNNNINSVMFFTLHVQPPRIDLSAGAKAPRGPSRLTMIDVCGSMKMMAVVNKTRGGLPQSGLGSVFYSFLSGNKNIPSKGSKLTMMLRESLGRSNCLTTVIGQVSDLPVHLPEALSTIYLVSHIRKQSTSCSPCGRSLGKDKRPRGHGAMRSFHSTGQVNMDTPRLRLCGDLDERSSSDQSCDTVIHIGSDGAVHNPKSARMLPLTRPQFVPIVPSLHHGEPAADDHEFTALLQELLKIPQSQAEQKKDKLLRGKVEPPMVEAKPPERDCLKCETFAELQERLGCIDGSEAATEAPKPPSKHPSVDDVTAETRPQKDTAAVQNESAKEAPKTLGRSSQEYIHTHTSVGEKKSDAAASEDTFQREDSGLYDCEDGSAASSTEEPQNQSLGRGRILRPNRSEMPNSATPRSSSDSSEKEELQGMGSPCVLGLVPQPTESQRVSEDSEWPLDRDGHDEIVYSMVEEVTISGAVDRDAKGRSIIRIRENAQSAASYDETKAKNYSNRQKNTDRHHPRGAEPVYPTATPPGRLGGGAAHRDVRNAPKGIAASLGCLATIPDDLKTNSLPRGWQGPDHGEGRRVGRHVTRQPSGMTSSTPSSPRVTMERRHRRHHRSRNDDLDRSPPPRKNHHSEDNSKRSDSLNGLKSAVAEQTCSWNFGAKLRQLARRTNSLGRTPVEFQSLDRGSSTASVSSRASSKGSSKGSVEGTKGSSKGSYEETFKGKGKRTYEGESTLARNIRSPKKSPRCVPAVEPSHHSGASNSYPSPQSHRSTSSKLSAVGKLKMATPRVRRVSNPGTKTLSFSHINRSASLSPDRKAFSRDPASCFPSLSSSPPWSIPSLSRTQSQSSSCCSAATKSPIHGVIDGRFSDFLKDRE
ncbi:hypothetical protein NHX12_026294, partial [Muraenolepis orangiensis]